MSYIKLSWWNVHQSTNNTKQLNNNAPYLIIQIERGIVEVAITEIEAQPMEGCGLLRLLIVMIHAIIKPA